jgi:TupA-like ATPgrasp
MSGPVRNAFEWVATQLHRLQVHRQFRLHMGFDGNFENPHTHQEKMQFRKIYGNHEFYARVADKYRVREYVANRVGEKYLIPLLAVHDRLKPEHFAALPNRFIIKANHGCKWHQIVRDKSTLDIDATVRRFNKYMRARYGWDSGERHYRFIKPKIVIEELLEGNTGGCPWDYSFFCYNGPTGFDYTYSIVAPDGRAAGFTRHGERLIGKLTPEELAPHLNPANFGEMIQVARALSADFDFVRVDLYSVGRKVYFGELTCTPHQGYGLIAEPRQQKMRNEMWHLDAYNPRLYRAPRAYGFGAYGRTRLLPHPKMVAARIREFAKDP